MLAVVTSIIFLGYASAQNYRASWDFKDAGDKQRALSQAKNSPFLSLFDPNAPPVMMGAKANVSRGCDG